MHSLQGHCAPWCRCSGQALRGLVTVECITLQRETLSAAALQASDLADWEPGHGSVSTASTRAHCSFLVVLSRSCLQMACRELTTWKYYFFDTVKVGIGLKRTFFDWQESRNFHLLGQKLRLLGRSPSGLLDSPGLWCYFFKSSHRPCAGPRKLSASKYWACALSQPTPSSGVCVLIYSKLILEFPVSISLYYSRFPGISGLKGRNSHICIFSHNI